MPPKAGYKGAVYIGAVKIGGSTTWGYGGSVRQMQAVDEFENEIVTDLPLQIVGGEITITGHYLQDSDAGQQLLATLFKSGAQITDIKLYTDKTNNIYKTPDDTTDPASYVTVVNYDNIGDDKSGTGTFTATLKVSGEMKQVGDTSEVMVVTEGVHSVIATECEFVGSLASMGGETPIECYFEYGLDTGYGDDTYATEDTLTEVGMFGATSGLLVTATTYHYRAVALYDTDKHAYGKDKTFVTL